MRFLVPNNVFASSLQKSRLHVCMEFAPIRLGVRTVVVKRWGMTLRCDRFVALGLLALFLFVVSAAQSGELHRLVHPDAGKPTHQCAATLLNCGQVEAAPGSATVCEISNEVIIFTLQPQPLLLVSNDYSLLPGRAPPVLGS